MAAWQLGSWSIEVERRRTGLSVGIVSMHLGMTNGYTLSVKQAVHARDTLYARRRTKGLRHVSKHRNSLLCDILCRLERLLRVRALQHLARYHWCALLLLSHPRYS
jgi:hypothetical protein